MASKKYELSNHLGNILAVVSDRKILTDTNGVHIYFFKSALVPQPSGLKNNSACAANNF